METKQNEVIKTSNPETKYLRKIYILTELPYDKIVSDVRALVKDGYEVLNQWNVKPNHILNVFTADVIVPMFDVTDQENELYPHYLYALKLEKSFAWRRQIDTARHLDKSYIPESFHF